MRISLFFLLLLSQLSVKLAAQPSDFDRIPVSTVLVGDIDKKSDAVRNALSVKLTSIANANGLLASNMIDNRFVIAANVIEEAKDISATTPTMFAYTLTVNIKMGDGLTGTVYNSTSISVKGLERSEEKAYLSAIRSIAVDKKEIKEFVAVSKAKIIDYYVSTCDATISKARLFSTQNKFDEALFELSVIPNVSSVCFEHVTKATEQIFKDKVEYECAEIINKTEFDVNSGNYDSAFIRLALIPVDASCFVRAKALTVQAASLVCQNAMNKARAAWSGHDVDAAASALAEVKAGSTCDADALALVAEIKAYKQAQEQREWKFELKKQEDAVKLEAARIKAARDIGVAYAKSRPKVIYRIGWF